MTREIVLLALFAALASSVPYWFLLGSDRRRYVAWDAGSWLALGALFASAASLEVRLAPSLVLAVAMAAKLAVFAIALTIAEQRRWSPAVAAAFSLGVFLIVGTEALGWPVDGDEAYYVLIAESILHDGDFDLANQYANLEVSVTRRLDLRPQQGDPVGPEGEVYSRHEPLLPLLLVPGVTIAGLWGAMATMALFGALLVLSLLRLVEQGGAGKDAIVRLWPLLAFGPPLLFYSTRVWPEVPAALCLSESMRMATRRRFGAMTAWLVALSLLQLRFALIAIVFFAIVLFRELRGSRRFWWAAGALALLVILPLAGGWISTGRPFLVHRVTEEIFPSKPIEYVYGALGLLVDAQGGLLFQAPLWFLGALGLVVVRSARGVPTVVRWAAIAALPYLFLLIPRPEWHGGWSPPLRYLVVFAPLVAWGAARSIEAARGWLAPVALWTAALAVHGAAFPWRLFHIASGESVLGEWLSVRWESDFSRLLPSLIRPNLAALAWTALLVAVLIFLWKARLEIVTAIIATVLVALFAAGLQPGRLVHLEDAHVVHEGGELYPELYTVSRFAYTGGWSLGGGDGVRFRMTGGDAVLHARAEVPSRLRVDGNLVEVAPTGGTWVEIPVPLADGASHTIALESGRMTLDRIEHE